MEKRTQRMRCWRPGRLVHPVSACKLRWDAWVMVAILYSVWMVPFELSFDIPMQPAYYV